MNFNSHFALQGKHAFLSASKYSWLGYDEEKLEHVFRTAMMTKRGTELHALAHQLIRLGVKLPRNEKTLNMYVNDAIGYRMTPEQVLYYSPNFFGTPDAISFRKETLRISDLKTGITQTSPKQLIIYAAFFCLEYGFDPHEIKNELRIYQNDEVRIYEVDPSDLKDVMQKIISFDRRLNELMEEAGQ